MPDLSSSKRPGESRSSWARRVRRGRVDDAGPGTLSQFVYDQLQAKGLRHRRAALGKNELAHDITQHTEN